jgi:hypothetical protein
MILVIFRGRPYTDLTKNMCLKKEEILEIKARVELTKNSEKKYNEWERVAPAIGEHIFYLKSEVERLEKEKEYCLVGVREIYLADVANDAELKKILFSKFGLPFVLNNN